MDQKQAVITATVRRAVAFLVGVVAIVLASKFGIVLDAADKVAITTMVLGYLGQSAANEIHDRAVEAKAAGTAAAAAPVPDPAAALAAAAGAPVPPKAGA